DYYCQVYDGSDNVLF
nr:immunoglobulin light chain junction region [Macaca mulatta]